jgi:hypothetical protein
MRPATLLSILALVFCTSVIAQQVTIGASDDGLAGGPKGAEAGVWLIAAPEGLIAFKDGEMIVLRVPCPLPEGGEGSAPLAVHFQLRPDPLAR